MKKTLQLLPLALLVVLIACSAEPRDGMIIEDWASYNGDSSLSLNNIDKHYDYVKIFIGQWFIYHYDIATQTSVLDADGNVQDNIRGRETREILASWIFDKYGWGTIALAKKSQWEKGKDNPNLGTQYPNDNLSPLFKYGDEFQWGLKNDSTMTLTLYMSGEKKDTFDAIIEWPQLTNADKPDPYWGDNLNLTIKYTITGPLSIAESIYPAYSNSLGYTCVTDVTLTYILQRN